MGTLLRTLIRGAGYGVIRKLGLPKTIAVGVIALISLWVLTGDARADHATSVSGARQSSNFTLTTTPTLLAGTQISFTLSAARHLRVSGRIACATCTNGFYGQLVTSTGTAISASGAFVPDGLSTSNFENSTVIVRGRATDVISNFYFTGVAAAGSYIWELRAARVGNSGPIATTETSWQIEQLPVSHEHAAQYCDADGTEADPDCATGDLSDYYTDDEVDAIAELASDTCGGPALPPCSFEYASGGGSEEKINLLWWGVWAAVGLLLCLMIAPLFLRLLDPTRGL